MQACSYACKRMCQPLPDDQAPIADSGGWQDCVFLTNAARETGGAMQVRAHGAAIISHTTFSRNSAKGGGALHVAGTCVAALSPCR